MIYVQPTIELSQSDALVRAIHEDGFALIPDVVPPDEVARARAAIDGLEQLHWDWRGPTDHTKCVFNRDPYWLRFLDWPGIYELAIQLMGGQCHVIGETAWRSHPGHQGVLLHADQLFFEEPEILAAHPELRLPVRISTAHVYLSDITLELCPTYVVRGSHRSGRRPHPFGETWQGNEAEPVLCKAGDVLFFRSELWHSGSNNTTEDQTRYLLQVHYGERNIAQRFSPYLEWKWNPEVLAAASPRQRTLLGDHYPAAYD